MTSTSWAPEMKHMGSPSGLSLVDGSTFVVSAPNGDLHADEPHGLFIRDTRMLSRLVLEVDDQPLMLVSAVQRGPFSTSIVTRAHHVGHLHNDPPITVLRHRTVGDGLREELDIRNHSIHTIEARLAVEFDADFASLFDVKGDVQDLDRGAIVKANAGQIRLLPDPVIGLPDSVATDIGLDPAPQHHIGHQAIWNLTLEPGQQLTVTITVMPSSGTASGVDTQVPTAPTEFRTAATADWVDAAFDASDERLDRAATQSLHDLAVLRIFDPVHTDRVVVAAGAPWFMALFGRDSILTAWMTLVADHRLAAGVLRSLADAQGRTEIQASEEQPGRILHEVRYDQRSIGVLGGSNVYYGTIDATPLFVMLVAEYLRWTNDRELVTELLPAVDRALAWIENYGDIDGDGFVEYQRSGATGLINQGWKDSRDGIRFANGHVAETPIALCEVQGYVYGAYRARAYLDRVCGPATSAAGWDRRADDLRDAVDRAFWLPERGTFAVGLDRDKRPIDSVTSNVGHCLWAGIVTKERASEIAQSLTSPEMFSGWGLRTLSSDNPAFNPLSYHCGSVWPHDTAIAIAGLERYGLRAEAEKLRTGLLDAAEAHGGRQPELFAGFDRNELPSPVAYPASCSPQAWAAGSTLLLLRSMIGLEPDLPNRQVRVSSRLLSGSGTLRARGIPLGQTGISIDADDQTVAVAGLDDDIELIID